MRSKGKARIAAEIKAFKNTDFSDCPTLTEEQIEEFKPSHLRNRNMANYRSIKKIVNARLDVDVIEWLKSSGECFHTRTNAILREAMMRSVS